MPSTSPGNASTSTSPTPFAQILPGTPTPTLQGVAHFAFRHKHYVTYISGRQLNLLSAPRVLIHAWSFDEELVAVAAEVRTGKLVVAGKSEVWALEPVTEGWSKVWWERALFLRRDDLGDETRWLSWGDEGEVLVGGNRQLSLFSTLPSSRMSAALSPAGAEAVEQRGTLWSKGVASPVQYAAFSPSANLIATCGSHDRLVKIWRRLSFEEGLFDYSYLPHPGALTYVQWRQVDELSDERRSSGLNGRPDEDSEVLYTIANDGVLRVWRTAGLHDLDIMVLHTTVDIVSAIPQSPSLPVKGVSPPTSRPARYTSILPSDQFCAAVSAAIPLHSITKISHSLEHLKDVASKEPDIVISFDGYGRMSAWGLQSVGHKRRPETPTGSAKLAYHITHAENLPLRIPGGTNARLEAWFEDDTFNLLAHGFNGEVRWWRGDVERFFSPSAAGSERLQEISLWTGHSSRPITTLKAANDGRVLLSCDSRGQLVHWQPGSRAALQPFAEFSSLSTCLDAALLSSDHRSSDYSITLEAPDMIHGGLDIVIRDFGGHELNRISHGIKTGCQSTDYRLFASNGDQSERSRLVILSSDGSGCTYTVNAMTPAQPILEDEVEFSLQYDIHDDPMRGASAILDASDLDKVGIVCLSVSGLLLLYHVDTVAKGSKDALVVARFESGVSDASILEVSNEFAAIASSQGNELTIVNLRDGYVEHRRSGHRIRHIAAAAKHNLVAVGYDTTVDILAQGRYEHHDELPAWILIRQVSIAGIGLTIDAICWLGDGSLAIAAGNGIFVSSCDAAAAELHADVQDAVDVKTTSQDKLRISDLARQLKKPLPVWHPSLMAHTVRHGHWPLATSLVGSLLQKLKFWSEGDSLHPLLNVPAKQLYGAEEIHNERILEQETITELMQQLEEKDLPEISQPEQQRLKRVLKAMIFCAEHVKGLDNAALRFLFSWKLEVLHIDEAKSQLNGGRPNGVLQEKEPAVPEMDWREIAFAYHSATQQPLLDVLFAHYDNKITWNIARRLGLFAWLSDRDALDKIFEALAQSSYRSTSPPDPINASLYFLALHKKPTLLALWRIATWHKEQRATMNFLRRDFAQPDNKTAAKKNAYALMGKRRFEYAASFFLLSDDAASATSLLAGQCGDVMLAIAVARLYSGDNSPVVRNLLESRLIPEAKQKGDRWLLCWCHSLLSETDHAADALVRPLDGLRNWHQDDPNTLTLYRQLSKSNSGFEYGAILRAARILRRMGLWLMALELVSQWEFKPQGRETAAAEGDDIKDQPSMLDIFSEPPAQDGKAAREAKAAELLEKIRAKKTEVVINEKKPEPTQFREPDASSLLDSFGF